MINWIWENILRVFIVVLLSIAGLLFLLVIFLVYLAKGKPHKLYSDIKEFLNDGNDVQN